MTQGANVFEGRADVLPAGSRVAVVVSRYNEAVTRRLLDGAVATLTAAGLPADRIDVAWVPGSFELPCVADAMAAGGGYAAVLCLGAIIRGETTHDQHIARAVAEGIEATARSHGLPVLFGVLTCDTLAQAYARAGGDAAAGYAGNKGAECAAAAVEMVSLLGSLPHRGAADGRGPR
jgi:6,7-dimethyl-8-ribityllumazine synthase